MRDARSAETGRADIFIATGRLPHRRFNSLDIRMRPAHRKDYAMIWRATLQTVWDDVPEDERARLDRGKWESHFRKKIERYIEGDRTEKWVAETAEDELLGYLILGESGFLTPEAHGFIYDIWVVPAHRGQGVGKFLVEWAVDWARRRGHRKIKLEVSELNARARHVYESLGFRAERRYMGKSLE
jgi:ribosomal protein S18 acetylase RimI-like enzyme